MIMILIKYYIKIKELLYIYMLTKYFLSYIFSLTYSKLIKYGKIN